MKQIRQEVGFEKSPEPEKVNVCAIAENFVHALNEIKVPYGEGLISFPGCKSVDELTDEDLRPLEHLRRFLEAKTEYSV